MLSEYKCILLFGPPGSGKGTQGKILNAIPGVFHCAIGDVLRNLDHESELGQIFFRYSSAGQLLPNDVTIKIWSNYIKEQISKGKFEPAIDLLVLDGIPRTMEQAEKMVDYINVLKVLHLKCDDSNLLIERIHKRNIEESRPDDIKYSIIQHRMRVYETDTLPVLKTYYSGKVIDIDASKEPLSIIKNILTELERVINKVD